jgi:hypothetical protein
MKVTSREMGRSRVKLIPVLANRFCLKPENLDFLAVQCHPNALLPLDAAFHEGN